MRCIGLSILKLPFISWWWHRDLCRFSEAILDEFMHIDHTTLNISSQQTCMNARTWRSRITSLPSGLTMVFQLIQLPSLSFWSSLERPISSLVLYSSCIAVQEWEELVVFIVLDVTDEQSRSHNQCVQMHQRTKENRSWVVQTIVSCGCRVMFKR